MTYEAARQIILNARKTGTLKFTASQRKEFDEAREVSHNWKMENEYGYARDFRKYYNQLAIGTGRLDLVGKY